MFQMSPNDKVLDYGCGDGTFASFLLEHGFTNVIGADVVKPEHFPSGVRFLDVTQVEEYAPYDVVTMLQVAEHIANAEDVIDRLAKLSRRVIVSIPNAGYWQHRLRLLFGRVPVSDVVFHMKEHVRLWTTRDFVDACACYGWRILGIRATVPDSRLMARLLPSVFARQVMFIITKK